MSSVRWRPFCPGLNVRQIPPELQWVNQAVGLFIFISPLFLQQKNDMQTISMNKQIYKTAGPLQLDIPMYLH